MKQAVLTFFLTSIMLSFAAFAQAGSDWDDPLTVRVSGTAGSRANFIDGGGGVAVYSGRTSLSWSIMDFSYEATGFDWENPEDLAFSSGSSDPISDLHRLSFGLSKADLFGEQDQWGYFIGAVGTSAFEKEMAGSYGGAFRAGLAYNFSEKLSIQGGLAYFVNSVSWSLIPVGRIVYNGVENDQGVHALIGFPEANVGYRFNSKFDLTAAFGAENSNWRLADDSSIESKGYLSTTDYKLSLNLDWKFAKGWRLSLTPEYRFERNWEIYDRNGNNSRKYDLSDSVGGSIGIRYRF